MSGLADKVALRFSSRRAASDPEGEEESSSLARSIPKGHPYDPRALKPMGKALWASSVALGHALTAYRYLSRVKSASVSPDGLLGGRGYVMAITDMRRRLYEACEALSSISDTLHDEMNADHWKPQLSKLDENTAEDVQRLLEESEGVIDDPEAQAEDKLREIEEENDGDSAVKTASDVQANSSIPSVGDLPGGPRVDSLEPGGGDGPLGSFNSEEPRSEDPWSQQDGGRDPDRYDYTSPWENQMASSGMPLDDTPTEGWDFGLGFGADGQGAGGYATPDSTGVGVHGPKADLPAGVNLDEQSSLPGEKLSEGKLPGDDEAPVARSDYYQGYKGNDFWAATELPGEDSNPFDQDTGLMNTSYIFEDTSTPYVRYDYTTHQHRDDPLHSWVDNDTDPNRGF